MRLGKCGYVVESTQVCGCMSEAGEVWVCG